MNVSRWLTDPLVMEITVVKSRPVRAPRSSEASVKTVAASGAAEDSLGG
jgi:hypothetical protein